MRSIISILIVVLFLLTATAVYAGEIESVEVNEPGNVTLPVVHDTTGRTTADLTAREKHFLSQVPEVVGSKTTGKTLRDACREMLLAEVIHVPALPCGNWTSGDSVRYWSIYQAWTGPHKVRIPIIRGPQGPAGQNGEQGPRGPRGPAGKTVYVPGPTVVIMPQNAQPLWAVTNAPQPYSQTVTPGASPMGGFVYAPTNNRLSSSSSACAAGGAVGPINIDNANTNVLVDNNVIAIDGTATGTSTGYGNSTAGPPASN